MAADPFALFDSWFAEARSAEPALPEAMALATANPDGSPSVRMVLLKDWGPDGFTFHTNFSSRKGAELAANPRAALCFHWKSLERSVRIEGRVEPVEDAVSDAYFATRGRASQLSAWASDQSLPLPDRATLLDRQAEADRRFADGPVPRPPGWGGLRLRPERIEFWREGEARLHHRQLFRRDGPGWVEELLYP